MRLLLARCLCTAGIVLPVAGADVAVDSESTGQPTRLLADWQQRNCANDG